MSKYELQFKGWQAIATLLIVLLLFGVRLLTFSDKKEDKELMKEVKLQLLMSYFPKDVDKLKAVYEAGDNDGITRVVNSMTTTEMNIDSLQISSPPLDFSTPKTIIVKASYSLNDASGTRETGTKFYRFRHGSFGNIWQYEYDSNVVSYYLNFI
jgi:hypothetical protein